MKQRFLQQLLMASTPVILIIWLAGCGALVTTPSPPLQATSSTAITRPYPTPQATQTIYSNTLMQQAAGWVNGPTCAFNGQGLAVRPQSGQAYICLVPTAPLTDLSMTVSVQQTSGPTTHAFGIAFRHDTPKNYYFFGIDGRGRFTLTVVINDVRHVVIPFTASRVIHQGLHSTNQLQVIAKGQTITLLVNGSAVGQATLSTFARGTVGLRGINDGEVLFHQLSIAPV